ncbi:splicing factor U2af large subunit B isoform X4 [Physcomitrium patens]|nr:splicing factor U2af large subunit B-like isoform X4 [Physcomitrium patens]XP_024385759.1 splicing factor U2af large subunit B-like isoform X4 [Physcomitrium patens]|eukprot:XP_024385758.1 splicing factor U2af large subunit B-like isoform X4 [Physcomitrella patens]
MPGVYPGMFPFGGTQFGGIPGMPAQAMTQQATRHARRVYVGGLPPLANEQTIATYFSQVMAAVGGNTAGPGDAVVNVYINQEKKFAFVEMRTVEEASNAMALDGIMFEGVSVRVRRPSDYNPSMAATLGPSQPSPHLNLAAVGLTPGNAAGGADGPDRIFVGGLPYYLTEIQIKELLESFGPLRGFDLVKDRDTGNSKGYGFCVYQDPAVTDVAIAALNGLKMGDKTLSVRRASASGQPKPDQANVLAHAQQQIAIQKLALQASGANAVALGGMGFPGLPMMGGMFSGIGGMSPVETPTNVVALTQVVSPDELKDDEEYQDILEDMKEECGKYGNLVKLVIPRPRDGEDVPGVGKVFVEYSDTAGAAKAKASLHGRRFGGHSVVAVYYPAEKFSIEDYGG